MEFLTITNVIIAVTCLISYLAFNNIELKRKLIFYPHGIKNNNQYLGFISSGFIHGDGMHLLFNMFTLFFFGRNVEIIFGYIFPGYGWLMFLLLYFLGLIFAHLPVYAKEKENPAYMALGASGAVSAVVFANILFAPWEKLYLYGVIGVPQIIAGVGYIWYSMYMDKKGTDNIGHGAHLYGALFGFLFTGLMQPDLFINFFECAISPGKDCIGDYIRGMISR